MASALRSLRSIAPATGRALAVRSSQRSFCLARANLNAWTNASRTISAPLSRQFSVSARRLGEGSADVALVQKLQEELQYEKDSGAEEVPEFVKAFQKTGVWTIEDVSGEDEVTLLRTFGNETVRLIFSVADLDTPPEFNEDEEDAAAAEAEGDDKEEAATSFPIRCSFSITKTSTPGAINIDAMCQDGTFAIDNISFYPDTAIGTELTAEADWKRRGLYIGPQFEQLDPGVQEEFDKWIQERGVDEGLAVFVPEYAEYKEQKEYLRWLEGVKKFVEK